MTLKVLTRKWRVIAQFYNVITTFLFFSGKIHFVQFGFHFELPLLQNIERFFSNTWNARVGKKNTFNSDQQAISAPPHGR
jgi:hypothetical protein